METYRIYALIHGQILPEGNITDCVIKKMSFEEQATREFAPIQAKFHEDETTKRHATYATSLAFVDPMKIKSEHVIVCDIEEQDVGSALGGAIRRMDKVCRLLSFVRLEDGQKHHKRDRLPFEPYIYQVNKVYLLSEDGQETSPDPLFDHGHVYLPDRPERSEWLDSKSNQLLQDLFAMHDEPLERALKYLYRSSIGHFVLDSPEKIALDHAKVIEIILKALSKKDSFEDKLREAKSKIELLDEEVAALQELWAVRSEYGDIAHASRFDQAERYPDQFPLPSNAATQPMPSLSYAANVCLKYFRYRQRFFNIDIEEPFTYTVDGTSRSNDGRFARVNDHIETNHLIFYNKSNKQQLIPKLKTNFCSHLNIAETDIEEFRLVPGTGCKQAIILVRASL